MNTLGEGLRVLVFVCLSAALAYVSRASLKAPRRRHDASLVGIEKTTQLVTTGVFRYIRHPLYSSLLLLAWGVFFKRPSWASGGIALAATAFLLATARVEEVENLRYFGDEYRAYMQRTRMFIPLVF